MGFKVDIKELTDYKNDIKRTSSAVKGQIENAIQSMRAIPSSQAMEGQVGMAVSETISSNHIPSLIGLKSSYDQLASEVEKTLNDFKSSTGESSGSAVITEDVLTKIPSKLDNLLESYNERTNSIKGIYTEISDLVSLTLPKSNLAETINDTKKHVKKIQSDVSTFENGKTSDSIDALLSQIESQIGRITSTKSLGYGSSEFLSFSMRNEFVSTMAQAERAMIQQERLEAEEIKKQKAEDWNRLGPYDYYLKYPEENGTYNPNFSQLTNSINGAVSNIDMKDVGKDILQDSYMGFGEELLEYGGSSIAYGFSNIHVNNLGTPLGSAAYLGQQGIGNLGNAMVGLGVLLDIPNLADDPMGPQKVTAHAAVGSGVGYITTTFIAPAIAGTALMATLPAWASLAAGVVVGVAIGTAINLAVDGLLDWLSGN